MEEIKDSKLSEQLERLSKAVEKSNSFGRAFLIGIVRGLGMIFGVTIIAAIALAIVWKVIQTVKLEDIIPVQLEEIMQSFGPKIQVQEGSTEGSTGGSIEGMLKDGGLENILKQLESGGLKKK